MGWTTSRVLFTLLHVNIIVMITVKRPIPRNAAITAGERLRVKMLFIVWSS